MPNQNSKRTVKRTRRKQTIKQRAQAIIEGDYDQDTRESIAFELQTNDPDLAELVERAEQGETICDTIRVDEENKKAARQVINLLNAEIIPLWLRENVVDALADAARRLDHALLAPALKNGKVTIVENPNPHFQDIRRNMANLLLFTQGALRMSARAKLAHAISTILNSEETPVLLYNAVGDFVTDISTPLLDDSPEIIEKALALEQEPLVNKRRAAMKEVSHAT